VQFNRVELISEPRACPGPASRQVADAEEIVSPAVQASMGKGKVPEVARTTTTPPLVTSKVKETLKAPTTTASSMVPTTNNLTPALNQYRYSFVLEDKEADKCMVKHLLDSNLNIPMHKLFAVSPDVCKQFHDLTTMKHITVGTESVNELSSQPMTEEFIQAFDQERLHSDDRKVVADHFTPLRCICAVTVGGRVLTCILDQGTEVVVMLKEVWSSLGLGLHADHCLNMGLVNMLKDSTLGVVENVLLDFGAGPMYIQVQVTECANFEILLGQPFFKPATCCMFDLPNREQDILLTDPNLCKALHLPTQQWVKCCVHCISSLPCIQHMPKSQAVHEEKGF